MSDIPNGPSEILEHLNIGDDFLVSDCDYEVPFECDPVR